MDRPETWRRTRSAGRVYVMLTNNVRPHEAQVSPCEPRPRNIHGHVLR
jgi:secreted PhoX family phosphatase